eukprot:scaffold8018_cov128-Skeletonema_dohrnii-CCMP3373.AAC.1
MLSSSEVDMAAIFIVQAVFLSLLCVHLCALKVVSCSSKQEVGWVGGAGWHQYREVFERMTAF